MQQLFPNVQAVLLQASTDPPHFVERSLLECLRPMHCLHCRSERLSGVIMGALGIAHLLPTLQRDEVEGAQTKRFSRYQEQEQGKQQTKGGKIIEKAEKGRRDQLQVGQTPGFHFYC
jgi:hypothetical protein